MEYLWAILALSSAIFFAVKDILSKKLLTKNVTPVQIIFEEYFLLIIIVLAIFFPHVDFTSFKDFWHLYFLKGLLVSAASFSYLHLLSKYEISTVSPLINLSPLFLLIFSSLILAETLTYMQYVGVMIIMGATYFHEIIAHHHRKKNPHKFHLSDLKNKNWKFFIIVLFMLLTFTGTAIVDKIILGSVNVYTNLYFVSFIILFILSIYYIKIGYLKTAIRNIRHEPETLVISIFNNISTFLVLFAISIPGAMVSLIIPLRRTSTIFSSLFGGILFHEKHLLGKLIATSGMLVGIVLIVI